MPKTTNAVEMLNRDFLDIRTRLLDLAAALDRIDRRPAAPEAKADPRYGQILASLRLLAEGDPDRAQLVQLTFSDPYQPAWSRP